MVSGSFSFPPPKGGPHFGYSWNDTVVANWTTTATNSTPCRLSLFFWPDAGDQNWTSSGWLDVPCTGTKATPLNIRNKPYIGQFNLNFTDSNGHSALYLSNLFDVGAPTNTSSQTFPASATDSPYDPAIPTTTGIASTSHVSQASNTSQSQSSSIGIAVGASMGGMVLLLLLVGLIFYFWRRHKRRSAQRLYSTPSSFVPPLQEKSAFSSSQVGWSTEKVTGPVIRAELPTEPPGPVEVEAVECKSRFPM